MRNFLIASAVALALVPLVHANVAVDDERTQLLSNETPHDRLFSILFEGNSGIAVGEAGLIKTTTDGGDTWLRQEAPTDLALIDIASNGTRSIAVGQVGLILVRDGDGPWRKVESGTDRRLLQVDINKEGLAFIVGAFGTLLKSTDGGDSWASVAPKWEELYEKASGTLAAIRDEPTNYIVDVREDGSALIGGEYGQIMYSSDGGECWQIAYRHPSRGERSVPTLFSMDIREDGVGFAVGQSGLVLRTSNSGLSWEALDTGVSAALFGVDSTADGQVIVVGQRASLRSSDNGETWKSVDALDLTLNWYSDIGRSPNAPDGEFIAVGHGARVIRIAP